MIPIIFSEQIDSFMTFASYNPVAFVSIAGEQYYIDTDNKLRLINGGYDIDDMSSYISIVTNGDYQNTKVFDNSEIYFNTSDIPFISSAYFNTSIANSDNVDSLSFDTRERTVKLAIPRESGDGFYHSRLRDKYLISTYTINRNTEENVFFSIPYIKTKYRYSFI